MPAEVKPYTKTTRRQVPLNGRALAALDQVMRRIDTPLVFPARRGGHFELHDWRKQHWLPALDSAGIPRRRVDDLRHTAAPLALAAGLQPFQLSRFLGTSVRMLDQVYGHLQANAAASAAAIMNGHIAATTKTIVSQLWRDAPPTPTQRHAASSKSLTQPRR